MPCKNKVTCSRRLIQHGIFLHRWLKAAAVAEGKDRLNFLTLHVIEVWPGLFCEGSQSNELRAAA